VVLKREYREGWNAYHRRFKSDPCGIETYSAKRRESLQEKF